ncbi:TPA: lipoprotein [Pseudomonas aeruginosa]
MIGAGAGKNVGIALGLAGCGQRGDAPLDDRLAQEVIPAQHADQFVVMPLTGGAVDQ